MFKRILIVMTHGPVSGVAMTQGVALAKTHDAQVLFFSVLPRYVVPVADMPMIGMPSQDDFEREATRNAERALDTATAVADRAGVYSAYAVGAGVDDAECIVEAASRHQCDVIVVPSAGRNAVMRLLSGSVIPGLITLSTIPVLVVRQAPASAQVEHQAAAPSKPGSPRRRATTRVRARRHTAA